MAWPGCFTAHSNDRECQSLASDAHIGQSSGRFEPCLKRRPMTATRTRVDDASRPKPQGRDLGRGGSRTGPLVLAGVEILRLSIAYDSGLVEELAVRVRQALAAKHCAQRFHAAVSPPGPVKAAWWFHLPDRPPEPKGARPAPSKCGAPRVPSRPQPYPPAAQTEALRLRTKSVCSSARLRAS